MRQSEKKNIVLSIIFHGLLLLASIHVTISLLNYYPTMTPDYFSTFPLLLLFLGYMVSQFRPYGKYCEIVTTIDRRLLFPLDLKLKD